MKAMRWIGFLILVVILSHFYWSQTVKHVPDAAPAKVEAQASLTPNVVPAVSSPPAIATPAPPAFQPLAIPSPPVPARHRYDRYAEKPKDLYAQFEVINGYAVAYGDTVLGKPSADFHEKTGLAELRPPRYWPNGEIPFLVKEDVVNPERIKSTLEFFNQKTNVKFVPFENQADAVIFVKGEKNCQSYLGRTGGVQPIFLSENCGPPEIAHELLHALGFVHEQSRIDRDQYVKILWDNIDEKFQSQYAMVPEVLMDSLYDSPFDPTSIMMYESHMFSSQPGLTTMTDKDGTPLAAPLRHLSESDIARVNRLYPK